MDENKQILDIQPKNGEEKETASENPQWNRPPEQDVCFAEPASSKSGHEPFHNYDNDPQPKQKVRRVGTVTLGIVLIVMGALLIWAMFEPGFSVLTIAKFSPAILILVGVEMIIGYFRSGGEKVKYDFLSMFVCFLLIFGSLIGTMVPALARVTVGWTQIEDRLHDDVEDSIYEATKDLKTIDHITVSIDRYSGWDGMEYGDFSRVPAYEDIRDGGDYRIYLCIYLRGEYADKASFAEAAGMILSRINALDLPMENISFRSEGEQYSTSLDLEGRYNLDLTAGEMEEKVQLRPEEEEPYQESYEIES